VLRHVYLLATRAGWQALGYECEITHIDDAVSDNVSPGVEAGLAGFLAEQGSYDCEISTINFSVPVNVSPRFDRFAIISPDEEV
jgi:hypothetical protein